MGKMYLKYFGLATLFLALSCETETVVTTERLPEEVSLDEHKQFIKETSLLMGRILTDKAVRLEVISKMKEVDLYDELTSFSYLLGTETALRKNEVEFMKTRKASFSKEKSLFRSRLAKEVSSNIHKYVHISKQLKQRNFDIGSLSSKTGGQDFENELAQLLAARALQIFYPYEGKTVSAKNFKDTFYITYAPLEYTKTNEAFKYVPSDIPGKQPALESIGLVDDDFLDENPVFVLSPIDACDIFGRICPYNEIFPIADKSSVPPPLNGRPKLLTYNVNHKDIEEDDIISTVMPRFRVKGKDWLGFGATHQKIEVYRGSPDGKITIKGGTITVGSKAYSVGAFRFRKKGVKKGWWHKVDREFDSDWNMSENEQVITVFSKHRFKSEASVELNTKAGLKLDKGKIKPVAEATLSSKIKISLGDAKQRGKGQLSRRQVLSTIVGNGVTGETYVDDGVAYNVKKVGIFSYYFKHYYTDL